MRGEVRPRRTRLCRWAAEVISLSQGQAIGWSDGTLGVIEVMVACAREATSSQVEAFVGGEGGQLLDGEG